MHNMLNILIGSTISVGFITYQGYKKGHTKKQIVLDGTITLAAFLCSIYLVKLLYFH